jgi:hypothetical protein
MMDGMGWKINDGDHDWAIYIGKLPHRKQWCMYEESDGTLEVLAFFRTEEKAKRAATWLEILGTTRRADR